MLTKEECENALENILFNVGVARSDYRTSGKAKEDYCTLNSLIEEHFSNPPLKFEELKEKTWYWYEPSKSWIYLFKPLDWEPVKGLRYGERIINHSVEGYYMDFKEGTLFRKQVEE